MSAPDWLNVTSAEYTVPPALYWNCPETEKSSLVLRQYSDTSFHDAPTSSPAILALKEDGSTLDRSVSRQRTTLVVARQPAYMGETADDTSCRIEFASRNVFAGAWAALAFRVQPSLRMQR